MSETSVERKHHVQRMEKTVEDVVGTERRVAAWRQLLKPGVERVSNEFSLQFSSVIQSCPALCDPMDCSTPGLPVHHQLPELLKLMSIESVMPSNHLILCHHLLLLPSIFPSIRVFSNESVLRIRWPKYWSFSFSPSNEYSGLISIRINWFDLLSVQETLESPLDCKEIQPVNPQGNQS